MAEAVNDTQGSLLGFLLEGPHTGWELLREVARGLQRFWNVTSSHLYRELKALESKGLVQAGEPGPRDRRPYAITPAGRAAFASWLARDPGPEQVRIPLLVTLWFSRHLDEATRRRILASQHQDHADRLLAYRALLDRLDSDDRVADIVRFGIAYEEAFVGWLESLPARTRG